MALPPEIAATILAISTVLLGAALGVPTFGIFLGWAAAALASGGRATRMSILGRCLVIGALFGAGTLAAQAALAQALGADVPLWVCTVIVLAIANPLMILLGRVPSFGSVPGMFIGFSTVLAVYLVDAAPISGNVLGALLVAASTNLTGLGFNWLNGRMTGRPRVAQPGPEPADPTLMK
ncbi:MAG: DUF1097 family protein [Actinomycetota bacterium]|nr:DUF1097 family protein [Actinomycetota bacterium]